MQRIVGYIRSGRAALLLLLVTSGVAAAAAGSCGTFGDWVDPFPTPVTSATSLFDAVDDDILEWAFTGGFTFPFYGRVYEAAFLNTNGGMTFGAGYRDFDPTAEDIGHPAIAVFWGDLDASLHGADTRAEQMRWRQSATCFQVSYRALQDYDEEDWHNTALLTLLNDGRISIEYGEVRSADILIAVFDGSHVDDRRPGNQREYRLSAYGSGVILYDFWADDGPEYDGALNGETILFRP